MARTSRLRFASSIPGSRPLHAGKQKSRRKIFPRSSDMSLWRFLAAAALLLGRSGTSQPVPSCASNAAERELRDADLVPSVLSGLPEDPADQLCIDVWFRAVRLRPGEPLALRLSATPPVLSWVNATTDPASAPRGNFTLLMADPDAPRPLFVHWLLADIPGNDLEAARVVAGYRRPSPPRGTHR